MFKALNGAAFALGIVVAGVTGSSPACAADFGVSLDVGNVAFGYRDGYWDHAHHWHHWKNWHEAQDYRRAQGSQYNDWNHDRDRDHGWKQMAGPPGVQHVAVAFNAGDVAFGYQDGYWDRAHQWHQWRNEADMREYRNAPGSQFNDYRHDRNNDKDWRDLALNPGDVAFGYQDGYWDHAHQWHQWRNNQEMRDYRITPGSQYNDFRHDRDGGDGWHG